MLTVRITHPNHKSFKDPTTRVLTFMCPTCGEFIAQMNFEITPAVCRHCDKPLADVRGLVEREDCRVAWHMLTGAPWEIYE